MELKIHGMDCAEEVSALKREVGPLVGGEGNLSFNLLKGTMTIAPSTYEETHEQVFAAIERAGLRAELWCEDKADDPAARKTGNHWRLTLTVASGLLAGLGFLAHALLLDLSQALGGEIGGGASGVPLLSVVLYLLAILAGLYTVLPKALSALKRMRPDMHLLMTVAVCGAIILGAWFEAATVAFLFSLSLLLESWSVAKARKAVEALLHLAPPTARLLHDDGREEMAPCEAVVVGSLFVVLPGERVPLDGRIERGDSEINQAPITGESLPVPKTTGAEVFAGTINGGGALEVRSTKAHGDTTLARIIRMVEQAQARRAPSERWVEGFAARYTPAVMALALAVAVVPPLLGASWAVYAYQALVLLVIACPCALVISTPVSIVAGLASAARQGVLIKGGIFLELPALLKAVALDKTGTLTRGRPSVVEVVPLATHDRNELLRRAAAIEARGAHPLARAIVEFTESQNVDYHPAEEVQTVPGKGVTARIEGKLYWLGSHRYLEERGQETPEVHEQLERLSRSGRSVVVVGNEDHVCGFIAVADTVRLEARPAVAAMRRKGIDHVVMLTGDNEGTAQAIAAETGIDEVRAELLPEDKVSAIEDLVARFGAVAMVGDGVNDAPAMARARLGIAMGAVGSDAAIETGDVALMTDDLSKIPWLIGHSRRTMRIIRQNIVLSLGVKALFFLLAVTGLATLWMAIAADMGVSLVVVFNALRLLRRSNDGARI